MSLFSPTAIVVKKKREIFALPNDANGTWVRLKLWSRRELGRD
jgi:hypothetical protein